MLRVERWTLSVPDRYTRHRACPYICVPRPDSPVQHRVCPHIALKISGSGNLTASADQDPKKLIPVSFPRRANSRFAVFSAHLFDGALQFFDRFLQHRRLGCGLRKHLLERRQFFQCRLFRLLHK